MEHTKSFVMSEFTNPSGEIVFRLSGWLDGKRIHKNCPTRAEAPPGYLQRLEELLGLAFDALGASDEAVRQHPHIPRALDRELLRRLAPGTFGQLTATFCGKGLRVGGIGLGPLHSVDAFTLQNPIGSAPHSAGGA